jgi:hypothetical protein
MLPKIDSHTSPQLPGMIKTLTAVQTDEDESDVSLVEETYLKSLKVRTTHLIRLHTRHLTNNVSIGM